MLAYGGRMLSMFRFDCLLLKNFFVIFLFQLAIPGTPRWDTHIWIQPPYFLADLHFTHHGWLNKPLMTPTVISTSLCPMSSLQLLDPHTSDPGNLTMTWDFGLSLLAGERERYIFWFLCPWLGYLTWWATIVIIYNFYKTYIYWHSMLIVNLLLNHCSLLDTHIVAIVWISSLSWNSVRSQSHQWCAVERVEAW